MISSKQQATCYQFSGSLTDFQIRVELDFNGMTLGNLPNFEQFAIQHLPSGATLDESLIQPHHVTDLHDAKQDASLSWAAENGQSALLESRQIRWQEKIERANLNITQSTSAIVPDDPSRTFVTTEKRTINISEKQENEEKESEEERLRTQQFPRMSRIFTYVDAELSALKQERKMELDFAIAKSSENDAQIFKPRRIKPLKLSAIKDPITCNFSEEQRQKRKHLALVEESMLIVAYLGNMDSSGSFDARDEHILCQITVINGRVMKVKPDFGRFSVKSRNGTYSATIRAEAPLEFDSLAEAKTPTFESNFDENDEELIGERDEYKFELPEKHTYWIHYFLTIEQTIDFPHDNFFVEYQVELPAYVSVLQTEPICGKTEICYSKEEDFHDIAQFSFPIELSICYPLWNGQPNEIITWPRILFRLISEDYWKRFYVSGYAAIHLPIQPGQHHVSVACWRVINPYNNFSTLKEFFLGQAIDLKSFESVGCKNNNQWTKIISKVGLQTESSGSLSVSVNCVHQSRQYISHDALRFFKYGNLMNRIGGGIHWRIMKALNEFEAAKKQLFRLRTLKKLPRLNSRLM